jgi:hypothetical protein
MNVLNTEIYFAMLSWAIVVILVLLLLFVAVDKNSERMTNAEAETIISHIERASRTGQRYGDFQRQQLYNVSPWQFFTLLKLRKKAKLDAATVKSVMLNNTVPDAIAEKHIEYTSALGPGTSVRQN